MNVHGIRAALERMAYLDTEQQAALMDAVPLWGQDESIVQAVVRIGLRACDEVRCTCGSVGTCQRCYDKEQTLAVIADILREAGVEVER